MVAADRAMYQAKALGKNQISGNPRPRRAPSRLLAGPEAISEPAQVDAPQPESELTAPAAATVAADRPSRPTATAFTVEPTTNGSHHEAHGEDEPDPADVRRQIAAARRNMDPDHQIRRAMDAFLSSPTPSRADREQGS
jgi:hypothetical protein